MITLLSLALTGMGFLSYNRPKEAYRILSVVANVGLGCFVLYIAYRIGFSRGLHSLTDVVIKDGKSYDLYKVKIAEDNASHGNDVIYFSVFAGIVAVFYFLIRMFKSNKNDNLQP